MDATLPPELQETSEKENNESKDDSGDVNVTELPQKLTNASSSVSVPKMDHLMNVADDIWRDNVIFTRQCLWMDKDLHKFLWNFLKRRHSKRARVLPLARYCYQDIRESIGNHQTKFILSFVFDTLVKYYEATKIPNDPNNNNNNNINNSNNNSGNSGSNNTNVNITINNNNNTGDKTTDAKKRTILYEWIKYIQDLFLADVESAYQFLYIISHAKSSWLFYLLDCDVVIVRELLVETIITAMKSILELERPLYYVRIEDLTQTLTQKMEDESNLGKNNNNRHFRQMSDENDDAVDDDNDTAVTTNSNAANSNNNSNNGNEEDTGGVGEIEMKREYREPRPQSKLKWFESASVIVMVLDEMCKNMLRAPRYWRTFGEYWLFFKLFAELGSPERQLLLDKYIISDCIRFYTEKRPHKSGLHLLIRTEQDEQDYKNKLTYKQIAYFNSLSLEDKKKEREIRRRIENERLYLHKVAKKFVMFGNKMGNDNVDPHLEHMVEMLKLLICSCAPPTLKNRQYANKNIILKCDSNMADIKYYDHYDDAISFKLYGKCGNVMSTTSLLDESNNMSKYSASTTISSSTTSSSTFGSPGDSKSKKMDDRDEATQQQRSHTETEYYRLPPTTDFSVLNDETKFLEMQHDDRKFLNDASIWKQFIQDNQNPNALAQIMCHLAWMNDSYSKKCCRVFDELCNDSYAPVFPPIFTCIRQFLTLDDYKESSDYISGQSIPSLANMGVDGSLTSEDEESDLLGNSGVSQAYNLHMGMHSDQNSRGAGGFGSNVVSNILKEQSGRGTVKYEMNVFSTLRIHKLMLSLIKLIRDEMRNEEVPEQRKLTEFVDELIQTNVLVSMWFRNNGHLKDVQWFRKYIRERSAWLSLPKGPELP